MPAPPDPALAVARDAWTQFLRNLARSKFLILLTFLGTVGGAYLALQILTELYDVRASILVKLGRENLETPGTVQKGAVFGAGIRREEVESEMRLLASRGLIEETVDLIGPAAFKAEPVWPATLGARVRYVVKAVIRWVRTEIVDGLLIAVNLKKQLDDREKAILAVESSLLVERERDADVITLRLFFPDPALAVRVLDTQLARFLDRHIEIRKNADVKEFFDAQVTDLAGRLSSLDRDKQQVMEAGRVSSVSDQRGLLLKRLQEVRDQIVTYESEVAMLRQQQAALSARLAALPDQSRTSETVTPNPSILSLKERITSLRLERSKLLSRYDSHSELIKNMDRELAALGEMLAREEQTQTASVTLQTTPLKQVLTQSLAEAGVKVAGLSASIERLRAAATSLEQTVRDLDAAGRRLDIIERERKISEEAYVTYVRRREEARISEELDLKRIANIAILSPPSRSIEPVYPRKLLIMALSLPLGLIFGVGLALLRGYYRDSVVKDEADVDGIDDSGYVEVADLRAPTSRREKGA